MIQDHIDSNLKIISNQIKKLESDIINIIPTRTSKQTVDRYLELYELRKVSVNRKKKDIDREIQNIQDENKFIETDKIIIIKHNEKLNELVELKKQFHIDDSYLDNNIKKILQIMRESKFIKTENNNNVLTDIGFIASQLREVHCLVFANILNNKLFELLDSKQIIIVLSCFTNINVNEEQRSIVSSSNDTNINLILNEIIMLYNDYQDFENETNTFTGTDFTFHYDLIEYILLWVNCNSTAECKFVLQSLEKDKGIFLGEFVKAITKINNISSEIEKIAESIGNISLLSKLHEIPQLTLKYVATSQSLYV